MDTGFEASLLTFRDRIGDLVRDAADISSAQQERRTDLQNLVVRLEEDENKVQKLVDSIIQLNLDFGELCGSRGIQQTVEDQKQDGELEVQVNMECKMVKERKEEASEVNLKLDEESNEEASEVNLKLDEESKEEPSEVNLKLDEESEEEASEVNLKLDEKSKEEASEVNLKLDEESKEEVLKVKLDHDYRQRKYSEAIREFRGEEEAPPPKVRMAKPKKVKKKEETVPKAREPKEIFSWSDMSICTDEVSFCSSKKKRSEKKNEKKKTLASSLLFSSSFRLTSDASSLLFSSSFRLTSDASSLLFSSSFRLTSDGSSLLSSSSFRLTFDKHGAGPGSGTRHEARGTWHEARGMLLVAFFSWLLGLLALGFLYA